MSLVINVDSPLIKKIKVSENEEARKAAAEQIYTLSLLSQRQLTPEEMKRFISSSLEMVEGTL